MPLARTFFHDAPHVRQKAHVKHAVGFVEHEEFDVVKLARALPQVIEQAARRRDDHIHAGPQGLILPAIADTPVHHRHAQIGEPRKIANGGLDLRRQLARGFQHQNARGQAADPELGQDRQGKRRCLPGAGLGAADDVLSGQNQRNGAKLNRRRLHVTHRFDAFQNGGGQAKFGKRHAAD